MLLAGIWACCKNPFKLVILSISIPFIISKAAYRRSYLLVLGFQTGLGVSSDVLQQNISLFCRTLNHQYDYTFDWTMLKQKAAQQAASSSGQGQQAQTPTGKQTDKSKSNMKG